VLDGIKSSPNQPVKRDGHHGRTLWGDLAWQLLGAEGYAWWPMPTRRAPRPARRCWKTLLAARYAPCVILIDELVAYVRQFEKARRSPAAPSIPTCLRAGADRGAEGRADAVLLASLPESDKAAGSQRGVKALEALAHYFGRVQALWKPVATEEAFEIVRRRLFARSTTSWRWSRCAVPSRTSTPPTATTSRRDAGSRYFERLIHAYPIHPEVFDRLYEDWSTLDNFQRTRGVLKLMAKVIHRLWKDNNNDPLIMPGSLPLDDAMVRNEVIYYLPQGWDPVIERDVDGERAETTEIENKDTRFGSVQACRRAARAVFLGSAPSTTNQMVRGLELERVMLGVVQPGQQIGLFKDALRRLGDRLHYLNTPTTASGSTRAQPAARDGRAQAPLPGQGGCVPAVRERVQRALPAACSAASTSSRTAATCPTTGRCAWWCCRPTPPSARAARAWPSTARPRS
jgi:predicted AAA+ superfamily ATPase